MTQLRDLTLRRPRFRAEVYADTAPGAVPMGRSSGMEYTRHIYLRGDQNHSFCRPPCVAFYFLSGKSSTATIPCSIDKCAPEHLAAITWEWLV